MQEIQYIGEHLLPGRLGHMLTLTAFVSAILSTAAFRKAALLPEDESWCRFSRISWGIHSISIFSVIGLIFYMMISQMYEYHYVWSHVSADLPMKYILSAFWEGQEGSFLLWMFWHVVLGTAVIITARKWEPGIMVWLSLTQVVLVSMILGIYITDDFRLGSSPFILLREALDAPIFSNPNYLSLIEGNGLNPLLQNYWMTIHPPILFLGFASVTIPFCFAMTGLWLKDHTSWMKPAMTWTLFSAGSLGLGILLGGAWAYEALTFGGYWTWDPVENMSLVPWLILLAAMHGNFIARHTNHSIRTTYIFYILAFLLILYSTFLTRSGILGQESVHSFTEMGLEWQLIGFIVIFAAIGGYFFASRYRTIPVMEKEESIKSREFWMFIGAMVLAFSSVLITFTTSIPVWNKILDVYGSLTGKGDMSAWHKAMPLDDVAHHNRFQLWIAVLIAILSGIAQALRFNAMGWEIHRKKFFTHIVVSVVVGGILALLISFKLQLPSWQYIVLLIAASYGLIANADYLFRFGKRQFSTLPIVFAHGGFALMLIGIMFSGLNKRIVSENRFAQQGLAEGMNAGESILLIKNLPMFMNGYWVTYKGDTTAGFTRTFEVEFTQVGPEGDTLEVFTTRPNMLYDRELTKIAAANPHTKRYFNRDIFVHITGLPEEQQDRDKVRQIDSALQYTTYRLRPGETIVSREYHIRLDSIRLGTMHEAYVGEPNDLVLSADLTVMDTADASLTRSLHPTLIIRKGLLYGMPDQANDFHMRSRIHTAAIDTLIPLDEQLAYEPLIIHIGESVNWKGYSIALKGIDKNIDHPSYRLQEGDIAIHGVLEITADHGRTYTAKPLYYIRDSSPFNLKAFVPELGLHVRLEKIDPATETFHVYLAQPWRDIKLPVEIAHDVRRNDFIVLQAIIFPGINLFWAGSLIMLSGLFLGMYKRIRKK